jgi:UDP-N-acetylmuramoylalanine--D-glutamate ligase
MGLANRAVAGALLRRGHAVVAVDDAPDEGLRGALADLGVSLVEDPGDLGPHVARAALVVPAPGLPEQHPVFALAREAAVPVVSELDLAAVWDDRPVAAITGTNGKTTVVELCVAALERSGRVAVAAGNTDLPLVAAIDDPATQVFVVEASSFRLARTSDFRPVVGTWLNFAPDHLDVHADLDAYERAKARVWDHLVPDGVAVANALDPVVMRHIPTDRRVVTFGGPDSDWRLEGDKLVGPGGPFTTTDRLWRCLPHDVEDVLAAAATVTALGGAPEAVAAAARAFLALPHRVTKVGEVDGVEFYDDSKATTPHATIAALCGFARVVLIAGGRNKGLDLSPLRDGADRVAAVVAIGESAGEIRELFAATHHVETARDMDHAVGVAAALAGPGTPVLLSPGCASFDWYRGYAERGDDFARAVAALTGDASGEGSP